MTPRYRIDSVLFHHSPCRCVWRCLPTQCTIGDPLAAPVDFLQTGLHHRWPKRGTQGGGCHSDLLLTWHLACLVFPPILDIPCSVVQWDWAFYMPLPISHWPPYGTLLGHKCKRAHPGRRAASTVCSPPTWCPHATRCCTAWWAS